MFLPFTYLYFLGQSWCLIVKLWCLGSSQMLSHVLGDAKAQELLKKVEKQWGSKVTYPADMVRIVTKQISSSLNADELCFLSCAFGPTATDKDDGYWAVQACTVQPGEASLQFGSVHGNGGEYSSVFASPPRNLPAATAPAAPGPSILGPPAAPPPPQPLPPPFAPPPAAPIATGCVVACVRGPLSQPLCNPLDLKAPA